MQVTKRDKVRAHNTLFGTKEREERVLVGRITKGGC